MTSTQPQLRAAAECGEPLVSIVIPCYNQARFLPECIDSALAQTHRNVEIVVVDDGSPDTTAEVVMRYPPVHCVRQPNRGLSEARNAGFRASSGEYLIFLDADDRLTPKAIEAHLLCFDENPSAGFVVGDIDHMTSDGMYVYSPRWPILKENQYEELLNVNHVANTIAVLFRRSTIQKVGDFARAFSAASDYELLLRAARCVPAAHHRNVVAQYRRHPASMSRNGVLMLRTTRAVMQSQRAYVKGNPRLEAAFRKGENYWRDHYGARTIQELWPYLRRGNLLMATSALLVLISHVRGRLALLPWKHRRRIWHALFRGASSID